MNSLSVIIVNWNSTDCLLKCIESISKAKKTTFILENIIIVDNGSDLGQVIELKSLALDKEIYTIIYSKTNLGFAKACNLGASGLNSDYLLFLNPDTTLFEDTLDRCMQSISIHTKEQQPVAVLGCRLVDELGNTQRCCSRFPKLRFYLAKCIGINRIFKSLNQFMLEWDHEESRYVDEVMGAFFLTSGNVFRKLEGFDERFFVYYEEVDYCKRVKDAGYEVYYDCEASVYHEAGGSSKRVKAERLFYELRSRYQYQQKHNGNFGVWSIKVITSLEYISRCILLLMMGKKKEISNVNKAYVLLNDWYYTTKKN